MCPVSPEPPTQDEVLLRYLVSDDGYKALEFMEIGGKGQANSLVLKCNLKTNLNQST